MSARIETVEEYLARGGKITQYPYVPPNRDDPAFSHFWQLQAKKPQTREGEELDGYQVIEP